jgi:hypothetical protein
MTIGHWTAAFVVATLLAGCNPGRKDTDSSTGGGMTSGATATDTTMTGGQGGMADTSMGGMQHDSTKAGTGADTTRP